MINIVSAIFQSSASLETVNCTALLEATKRAHETVRHRLNNEIEEWKVVFFCILEIRISLPSPDILLDL